MRYVAYTTEGMFEERDSKEGALKVCKHEFVNEPGCIIYLLEINARDLVENTWILTDVDTLVMDSTFNGEDVDSL